MRRRIRVLWRLLGFVGGSLFWYAAFDLGRLVLWFVRGDRVAWRNRVVRGWGRMLCQMVGCRVTVRGKPPKPPFVLVCNHLGYMDIPVLFTAVDGVFVAKKEVRSWPLMGYLAAGVHTIFVDRSRRADVVRVNQEIADHLSDQQGLILFPEGTSSRGAEVLRFRPSLLAFPASQNRPVFYATLTYRTPPGEMPADQSVCWWDDDDVFFWHLLRFLGLPSFEAVLTFGPDPVVADDRKVLAETLWQRVRDQFEPVVSEAGVWM